MIKKFLLAIAIAIPACLSAQSVKFGIVSAEEIIPYMPEYTEAQNKIAEASKLYEDEYGKLNEELQKKYAEFQELDKDAATPQGIKDRRLQEIQELNRRAEQFLQTAQQDLQKQQAQLLQPIQEKVMAAIKAVGDANNLTMVFPTEVPAYVSADVIDITTLVKTQLGVK